MNKFENFYNNLINISVENKEKSHSAYQLLKLHSIVKKLNPCVVVEIGTNRGNSTKTILHAMHNTSSKLFSIDIADFKNSGSGENFNFIQSDSLDLNHIKKKIPLEKGIDLIYIDGLHTKNQVLNEISLYYKYVKSNGYILLDDIDHYPYSKNQRKDNLYMEKVRKEINTLVRNIFYNNFDKLELQMIYGSTGLAILKKKNDKDLNLDFKNSLVERNFYFLHKILRFLKFKNSYKYKSDGSSYLIK